MESLPWLFKCSDSAVQQNDKSLYTRETNCSIHWIEIDSLDSTIKPLKNQRVGEFVRDNASLGELRRDKEICT